MKNLFLSAILVISIIMANGQTYQEYKTPHGENYFIKDKEGRSSCFQILDPEKNVRTEVMFSDPEFHRADIGESVVNEDFKNMNTFHLTLHFDQPQGYTQMIAITSDEILYSAPDITWSTDNLTGEIDLPENNYEIMAIHFYDNHDVDFVCLHDIVITGDTDTTINFSTMAINTLAVECKDENNEVIDPANPDILEHAVGIGILFPDNTNLYMLGLITYFIDGDYRFSEVNAEYKIVINRFNVIHGKMYVTDMGELDGITENVILQNDPVDFKKMDMAMHASPTSQSNYLNFNYGIHEQMEGVLNQSSLYGFMNLDYPSFDKDTIQVFMSNKEHIGNNSYLISFLSFVDFWEELPNDTVMMPRKDFTQPFFVTNDDKITFEALGLFAGSYQFPDNTVVNIGETAPYIAGSLHNTPDYISSLSTIYGQFNENRQMDKSQSIYEIKYGTEVLDSGTLSDFALSPFLVVPESGEYSFKISDNNFTINGVLGSVVLESVFDLRNADATSPEFSSFKLLNSENLISNILGFDEQGEVLLSSYDVDFTNYQYIEPASVEIYFKKFENSEWTELDVTSRPELNDSNYGFFYSSDLSPALSQFSSEGGYLDMEIVITDETGNSSTQTWHALAYVENNMVGIQKAPTTSANSAVQVYPNPVNDVLTIEYQGSDPYRINILNTMGETVYIGPVSNSKSESINMKSLNIPDGIYLIQLITDSKTTAKKIIFKN